jgi:peptide/nickel transport system permease protein
MAAAPGTVYEAGGPPVRFLLGADTMGRDILSRLIYGARVSMAVGFFAPLIGLFIGGFLGCVAGFYGGRMETAIVMAMDVILAFPGLILLMAVSFYLGAGLFKLIATLGLLTVPAFCRVARARALVLARLEFIDAARLTGCGGMSILIREIIPNVFIPLTVYGLMVAAFLIMAEGALSFLGLGIAAPTPSWGAMIAEGKEVMDATPHISLVPAAAMFVTVLAFNMAGDAIRKVVERRENQL